VHLADERGHRPQQRDHEQHDQDQHGAETGTDALCDDENLF
jgi:hypothetical protein